MSNETIWDHDARDAPELNGADYRALHRLSTADDETLADVGETCERVPASSLAWLLAYGLIAPVTPPEPPPHRRAADRLDEEP